jgi:hypothetical protein
MPTSLHDLPALVVREIVVRHGQSLLHGVFTHVRSVNICRSWLNAGAPDPLIGDLIALDEHTRVATFEAPFWSPSHAVQVGSVAPWLDGQWQAWYVTMILDPDAAWTRRVFPATFTGDHEHCLFCMAEIGRGDGPSGYQDADGHWLCVTCAERYALRRSLGFVWGHWGVRRP